ncbi:MAG TPA: ABC transporter permease [Phycisphaerae bacterium]|nr:ABC transporter permease [Phycisphaerae bacterium]HNU46267.1 ABC transporter permease [Phycisphaerae bacterium]
MQNVPTVMRRELAAYFLSPIAYIVAAVFLLTAGLAFGLGTFRAGGEASLRPMFDGWIMVILVFVIPVLTMRLLAEEVRAGTIEMLMTAPVTEVDVVLGKFLGAYVYYLVLLVIMLVYPLILSFFGPVDGGLLACHYLGLLLLGALYISVGLFFSACTPHQMIAVLLSLAVLVLMTFASHALAQKVTGALRALLQQLSIRAHFMDFVRGLVDLNHVVFFLTTTVFFLFLTVKWLEMRRWR